MCSECNQVPWQAPHINLADWNNDFCESAHYCKGDCDDNLIFKSVWTKWKLFFWLINLLLFKLGPTDGRTRGERWRKEFEGSFVHSPEHIFQYLREKLSTFGYCYCRCCCCYYSTLLRRQSFLFPSPGINISTNYNINKSFVFQISFRRPFCACEWIGEGEKALSLEKSRRFCDDSDNGRRTPLDRQSTRAWCSLVIVGGEACIGPSRKLLCLCQTPKKIMQDMHGITPYKFDCWANPVVHLLLLKCSMIRVFKSWGL